MKKILLPTFILSVMLLSPITVEAKTTTSKYGPTALCRDGTYSYSSNHRGTCSWHKGVKVWYK